MTSFAEWCCIVGEVEAEADTGLAEGRGLQRVRQRVSGFGSDLRAMRRGAEGARFFSQEIPCLRDQPNRGFQYCPEFEDLRWAPRSSSTRVLDGSIRSRSQIAS